MTILAGVRRTLQLLTYPGPDLPPAADIVDQLPARGEFIVTLTPRWPLGWTAELRPITGTTPPPLRLWRPTRAASLTTLLHRIGAPQ